MVLLVDRDKQPTPSVPFVDPIPPRRTTRLLDGYALPSIYWRRIPKGRD